MIRERIFLPLPTQPLLGKCTFYIVTIKDHLWSVGFFVCLFVYSVSLEVGVTWKLYKVAEKNNGFGIMLCFKSWLCHFLAMNTAKVTPTPSLSFLPYSAFQSSGDPVSGL